MNNAGGYISLHRQILDWEWYKDPVTRGVFIHLIVVANFKDTRFVGKKIRRGQLVTSLAKLAEETGFSVQQVKTAIKHLISTNEITNESCTQYRIITIVNYHKYQTSTNELTNEQQTSNKRLTNDQQHHNKVIRKEGNKVINKSSVFTPPTPDEIKSYSAEINGIVDPDQFYDHYQARGWVLKSGQKMKDWKATLRTWERREKNGRNENAGGNDQKDHGTKDPFLERLKQQALFKV